MSEVNTPQNRVMIKPNDAVMLLIDHQNYRRRGTVRMRCNTPTFSPTTSCRTTGC